jgi:hypothetical protein
MSETLASCKLGHLYYRYFPDQDCSVCFFQQRLAARAFSILHGDKMDNNTQTAKESPSNDKDWYYCDNCTAHKKSGWKVCPFCASPNHYFYVPGDRVRVFGSGLVPWKNEAAQQQTTMAPPSFKATHTGFTGSEPLSGLAKEIHAQMQSPQETDAWISSEEDHFNAAVRTVSQSFEKIKRVRKSRDKAEYELKGSVARELALQKTVDELKKSLAHTMDNKREPLPILSIIGVSAGNAQYPLGIIDLEKSPAGVVVKVSMP